MVGVRRQSTAEVAEIGAVSPQNVVENASAALFWSALPPRRLNFEIDLLNRVSIGFAQKARECVVSKYRCEKIPDLKCSA